MIEIVIVAVATTFIVLVSIIFGYFLGITRNRHNDDYQQG